MAFDTQVYEARFAEAVEPYYSRKAMNDRALKAAGSEVLNWALTYSTEHKFVERVVGAYSSGMDCTWHSADSALLAAKAALFVYRCLRSEIDHHRAVAFAAEMGAQ